MRGSLWGLIPGREPWQARVSEGLSQVGPGWIQRLSSVGLLHLGGGCQPGLGLAQFGVLAKAQKRLLGCA